MCSPDTRSAPICHCSRIAGAQSLLFQLIKPITEFRVKIKLFCLILFSFQITFILIIGFDPHETLGSVLLFTLYIRGILFGVHEQSALT